MTNWLSENRTLLLRLFGTVAAIVLIVLLIRQEGWTEIVDSLRQISPANTKVKIEMDKDSCSKPTMGNVAVMGTPVPIKREKEIPTADGISNIEDVRRQVKQKRQR